MRFFSGTRDSKSSNGKPKASDLYKQRLTGKPAVEPTREEKYRKMIEARLAKLQQELVTGQKKTFKLPGTKEEDKPRALSKNAQQMLAMLAQKKARAEMKKQKKREYEAARAQKARHHAEEAKKAAAPKPKPASTLGTYFFGIDPESR